MLTDSAQVKSSFLPTHILGGLAAVLLDVQTM
jgi:hypothetical protein